jgi:hypothetical protein
MNDECTVSPVERMNDFVFNIELLRAMAMLRKLFKLLFLSISIVFLILEVTIVRKVLPHPQGIKGSMRNLLNKGLFI